MLLESLGLSPWMQLETSRIHYVNIAGMLLLLTAAPLLTGQLRLKYARPGRWVFAGCIICLFVVPYVIQGALMTVHANRTGVTAIDFVQKDAKCNFSLLEERTETHCELTILNYGKTVSEVNINPLFFRSGQISDSVIEPQTLNLRGHSRRTYSLKFTGTPVQGGGGGMTTHVGLHVTHGGQSKTVHFRE